MFSWTAIDRTEMLRAPDMKCGSGVACDRVSERVAEDETPVGPRRHGRRPDHRAVVDMRRTPWGTESHTFARPSMYSDTVPFGRIRLCTW